MVVYFVIMVLVSCYSLLSPCSCARQVEFKYIRGDHGPSTHNYDPKGYNDGMSMTEKHLEVHNRAAASELDLSSLPRKLLVESTEMKKGHQNNKELSGVKDAESRKSGLSSMQAMTMITSQSREPEKPRTSANDAKNDSKRRMSSTKPIQSTLSAEAPPLHGHPQDLAGDDMEMDYSSAQKRPPIHN